MTVVNVYSKQEDPGCVIVCLSMASLHIASDGAGLLL